MILYSSLLISLVFAGGPQGTACSADPNCKVRRSTSPTQFYAITTFPYPNKASTPKPFCLWNEGAGRAQLNGNCQKPELGRARTLFTFEPANGYPQREGRYTMKSAHDGLCVNFNDAVNQDLTLPMTDCASFGAMIPWFFKWDTNGKNPGTGHFANPDYAVIASPFANFTNKGNLEANGCFYSNSDGGININTCQDNQEMTWFAYLTENEPTDRVKPTADSEPCTRLYNNQNNDQYGCSLIVGGYSVRPPFDSKTKQIAFTRSGVPNFVHGMTRGILKKGIVSFRIKPSTTVSQTADIAQLGYIGAGGARKLINHIGLVAGTTKVRFYNDWYKATIITTSSLPLNNVTLVKIRETFATLSSGNTTAEFEIFFDDKQVAYLKTGPKSKQVRTDDLYFAAPPKRNMAGTGDSVLPKAEIGPIKIRMNDNEF